MTIEQIKDKIRVGDYILLGKILDETSDNARMRFRRGYPDAVHGMEAIIENRQKFIEKYKSQKQKS